MAWLGSRVPRGGRGAGVALAIASLRAPRCSFFSASCMSRRGAVRVLGARCGEGLASGAGRSTSGPGSGGGTGAFGSPFARVSAWAPASASARGVSSLEPAPHASRRGQRVLEEWIALVAGDALPREGQIRSLLSTAAQLQGGRLQSSVPGELVSLLAKAYARGDDALRMRVLSLLVEELGTDERALSRAARAWLRVAGEADEQGGRAGGTKGGADEIRGGEVASLAPATRSTHFARSPSSSSSSARRSAQTRALASLEAATRPAYESLIAAWAATPGGIAFLVQLRADCRRALKLSKNADDGDGSRRGDAEAVSSPSSRALPLRAHLALLDTHLRSVLAASFAPGLVRVSPLRWETAGAGLLERLMAREAVHPFVGGWAELKARLGRGRRVFVATHPCLEHDPLAAVYIRLGHRIPRSIQEVMHDQEHGERECDAADADQRTIDAAPHADGRHAATITSGRKDGEEEKGTPESARFSPPAAFVSTEPYTVATFYSISSMQPGLAGIDLGHQLILRAASALRAEHPSLDTLCTLSPIPGLAQWVRTHVLSGDWEKSAKAAKAHVGSDLEREAQAAKDLDGDLRTSRDAPCDDVCGSLNEGAPRRSSALLFGRHEPWASERELADLDAALREFSPSGAGPMADADGARQHQPTTEGTAEPEGFSSTLPSSGGVSLASLTNPPPSSSSSPYSSSSSSLPALPPAAGLLLRALTATRSSPSFSSPSSPSSWSSSPALSAALRPILLRLAARYLLCARRRGEALDRVAAFHLRNGAVVGRLRWDADQSPKGRARSFGIMVNYLYRPKELDENNRAYVLEGRIQAEPQVQTLAKMHAEA